jgi:hypothetical protein
MSIPVTTSDALAMLNLPAELTDKPVFDLHKPLVMQWIESVTNVEDYTAACGKLEDSDPHHTAFRFGYAFRLLQSTAELLNLKTLGAGIVKTIGLDTNATELLTGAEIDAFKTTLERRALEALSDYLNDNGNIRLDALTCQVGRRVRAVVI